LTELTGDWTLYGTALVSSLRYPPRALQTGKSATSETCKKDTIRGENRLRELPRFTGGHTSDNKKWSSSSFNFTDFWAFISFSVPGMAKAPHRDFTWWEIRWMFWITRDEYDNWSFISGILC
jgi:hypothetical protein